MSGARTQFNPEGKVALSHGDCLRPAMGITDGEDATQYLRAYVAFIERALVHAPRTDGMTAEQIAKVNLGYFAGYYDRETRERVERLFDCSHPIFGRARDGTPSPEQALAAGLGPRQEERRVIAVIVALWLWLPVHIAIGEATADPAQSTEVALP